MAAPTLISYTEVASWATTGTSKSTASVSWNSGDVITVVAGSEGGNNGTLGTPTATGLTFAKNQDITANGGTRCAAFTATAVAGSNSSGSIQVTNSNSGEHWGFGVFVHRSSTGAGNSAQQATSTKTKALTPTAADGAIVWGVFDFNADAAGSGTPSPTNTRQAAQDAGHYTRLVCDLADQTSSGSVSYGQSGGGTTGPFSIVIQEIKNDGGGGATVTYPELERHLRGVGRGVLS